MFNKKRTAILDPNKPMPKHIGFIMDGNGRWAKKRGLPRSAGHRAGASVFKARVTDCIDLDIPVVTVYAFSTENWKRPQEEVDGIMELFIEYMKDSIDNPREKNMKIHFIGDRTIFSKPMQELMAEVEEKSAKFKNDLNIAVNYGSRAEIVNAVNLALSQGRDNITEEDMSSLLYTSGQPDPDLIIRTGGESRISNFLLWQSAYAEFYFTKALWPDFSTKDLHRAIHFYQNIERRFGDVGEKSKRNKAKC